ncbi:HWE histidine kinase domain-containing protein [Methylobacterium sp. Leaf466]|uniref:HWE histidine kinase domain-containing protein n=1 Tax=Methylobacterium sp. Leaf466 TaxID=1736386 RepID=UPI000701746B|nr:HWE histidine kinase domain-containing protein [Methylobacterium sp. Leaf466]KQT84446.1 histidine kinase [Methylobacterium sp. Leaf466]
MTVVDEQNRIASEILRTHDGSDPFAAATRATRMPMVISNPRLPDNPIVFVNDAFLRLTGYARHEILGRNCRFLQGPATDPGAVAAIREAIADRVPIEIDLLNHRKDGSVFWNRVLISPVLDEDGALSFYFASQFDVSLEKDRLVSLERDRDDLESEVARRSADLTRSENLLRFALKAGRLGSWTLALPSLHLVTSEDCKANFGRAADESFTYEAFLACVVPGDRGRVAEAVNLSLANGIDYDIEYRILLPNGENRWIHARGQPFTGPDGRPETLAGITMDVTERKRVEEHRVLLANELTHRVKNTFATIQSIVNQTLRSADSVEGARKTLESRLVSLAAAHDMLTQDAWEGTTLGEIVAKATGPFQTGSGSRFLVEGPPVRLPPRISLAFSMALHELATNAVKYGALSNEDGRVRLTWTLTDQGGTEQLDLRWEETGGPPVVPPTRTGFGSRMIERALSQELNGQAEIAYRPEGVVFVARAPLPSIEAETSPQGMPVPAGSV